jgi:hypothetical protein
MRPLYCAMPLSWSFSIKVNCGFDCRELESCVKNFGISITLWGISRRDIDQQYMRPTLSLEPPVDTTS